MNDVPKVATMSLMAGPKPVVGQTAAAACGKLPVVVRRTRQGGRQRGFTLIELVITVAILAIITAVALPSYSGYVQRGKLTESFNMMTSLAMSLEQYFQDNRTYVGACAAAGNASLPAATTSFVYACPVLTATTYTITATGQASGPTSGFAYSLDQSGNRATTAAPSGWPTNATCWVNNKSGTCQ